MTQSDISILVVEDDNQALEIVAGVIRKRFPDAAVYLASDGEAGLALFKERRPDIVISDIRMPRKDGIRLAGDIRALSSRTKILFMTAYSDAIHLDTFHEIGISHILVKPLQFNKLFQAIETSIEEVLADRKGGEGKV